VRVERLQPRGAVELGARRAVETLAHEPARERDPIGGLDAATERLVDEPRVRGVHAQPVARQACDVSRQRTWLAAVAHDRARRACRAPTHRRRRTARRARQTQTMTVASGKKSRLMLIGSASRRSSPPDRLMSRVILNSL